MMGGIVMFRSNERMDKWIDMQGLTILLRGGILLGVMRLRAL